MKAFVATVDLVIHADNWVDACNALQHLLTTKGMYDGADSPLIDWAYVPTQRRSPGAWPKAVTLSTDWLKAHVGERDASLLFPDRQHVEPMLILSNNHLSPDMHRLVMSMAPGIIEYDYGWIVHAAAESESELEALAPLLAFARERGCLWIKFDRDGPVFERLPFFDW
jgi:hypothetical protein